MLTLNTATIASFGFIGLAWNKIKETYLRLTNVFIFRATLRLELTTAVRLYLKERAKRSFFDEKTFITRYIFVKSLNKKTNVPFCFPFGLGQKTTIWLDKKPIRYEDHGHEIKISYFRPFFKIEKIIELSMDRYTQFKLNNENPINRFYFEQVSGSLGANKLTAKSSRDEGEDPLIQGNSDEGFPIEMLFPVCHDKQDLGECSDDLYINRLYISEEASIIVEELKLWKDNEKWFMDKGLPWKRGVLLWGPPGTGKSAFVRAIGQLLNIPVFVFDLSTMNNNDFIKKWKSIVNSSPCIALFEDFDAVFNSRINISENDMNKGVTFDCFLNQIDGAQNVNGVVTIITTNNLESIDSAIGIPTGENSISSRPGRIDKVIEMGYLSPEHKIQMANRILCDFPEEKWGHVLENKQETGAQFQEKCSQLAIKLFWESKLKV